MPQVLERIGELSAAYGLRVANVFHAGDGNLHPLVLYDSNVEGDLEKAESLGAEILKLCVEVGGVLSGEHGVGIEKRDLMPCMFKDADLDAQERVKAEFDPQQVLNPGKVFPTLRRCAEGGAMHVHQRQGKVPRAGAVLRRRAHHPLQPHDHSCRGNPRGCPPPLQTQNHAEEAIYGHGLCPSGRPLSHV